MQNDYIEAETGSKVLVHTGFPNPAIDTTLRELDLNRLLVRHGASTFLMRIKGNEWQDMGIFAGDIALVDRALSPQKNDLVIWWHEDEFAVSASNQLPGQAISWGVVTSVIHQFRGRK